MPHSPIHTLKAHFPQCFDKNGDLMPHKLQEAILDLAQENQANLAQQSTTKQKDNANNTAQSDTAQDLQEQDSHEKNAILSLSKETYTLNWLGKSYAKLLRHLPTDTLIAQDLAHNAKAEHKDSKNVLIKGDNLEVLKHLKNAYYNKIKMIYIDPPYNTGKDGFIYNDERNFTPQSLAQMANIEIDEANKILNYTLKNSSTHSAWLSFMYPRLYIARQLLRDDGVIFISIDDNEQANLKILCDEIFGEDNFVYQLSVVDKLNGNDNSSGMMETQEYCLIYAKDKSLFEMGVLPIEEEVNNGWQEYDLGWWKEGGSLKATGENAPREKRPNLFYSIFIDEKNLTFSLEKDAKHTYELLPITNNKEMSWYWKKEKMINEANEVIIKKTNGGYSLYKKQRPALGDMPSKRGKTTFYSPKYSTANSNAEIQKIFKAKVFSYSKSKDLIKDFICLAHTAQNGGGGRRTPKRKLCA